MKVIITFTCCCNNLWNSKFMSLEKPGILRKIFPLLCGHPDSVWVCVILLDEWVLLWALQPRDVQRTEVFGQVVVNVA